MIVPSTARRLDARRAPFYATSTHRVRSLSTEGPPLNVELVRTTATDEPVLGRLLQLYGYDFSEVVGMDVGDDGLFDVGTTLARCWAEPSRHVFWCKVDAKLAGFAILDERSRLTGDPGVVDIAEFFVMRKYRRQGVGSIFATRVFDLYPRRWEVRERAQNTAARAFWRKAIDRYTGGNFEEILLDDERWRGPMQSFDARAKATDAPAA